MPLVQCGSSGTVLSRQKAEVFIILGIFNFVKPHKISFILFLDVTKNSFIAIQMHFLPLKRELEQFSYRKGCVTQLVSVTGNAPKLVYRTESFILSQNAECLFVITHIYFFIHQSRYLYLHSFSTFFQKEIVFCLYTYMLANRSNLTPITKKNIQYS